MKRTILWLILAGAIGASAQNYSNVVFPATTLTATSQTVAGPQLTSSYSAGTIALTGTSLTTATFAVYGCTKATCASTDYTALAIETCSTPGTFATTQTATANGCYQVNLAGITAIEYVTSGTFTGTSIALTLTASPNAQVGRGGGGGGGGGTTTNALTFATTGGEIGRAHV